MASFERDAPVTTSTPLYINHGLKLVVKPVHLSARRAGVTGKVMEPVRYTGDTAYFVKHDDGTIAAYDMQELELVKPQAGGERAPRPVRAMRPKRTSPIAAPAPTPEPSLDHDDTCMHMVAMVHSAIDVIRAARHTFTSMPKRGYGGKLDDMVTSADVAAQEVYVRSIARCFPGFGVLGEEQGLRIPCTFEGFGEIYFAVDPLDGTKAFIRGQSHGIGTMLSLVHNGKVVAVCIGNVMTREIYISGPGSNAVHRISDGHREELVYNNTRPLRELYVSLRERPELYGKVPLLRDLIAEPEHGGAFKNVDVMGGSIGTHMARLWQGEIAALVTGWNHQTPWDDNPIIGMCEKMGFVTLASNEDGSGFVEELAELVTKCLPPRGPRLIIHRSLLPKLEAWVLRRNTGARAPSLTP